ncbi:uncharacterized protein DUF58 [Roseimicrobium gellanilyticum]|uniref:Uncharacterized protein DUF58 n=1 Tax=Roseimicrobium gellanilyticum TaxID=748857 RepID=A0A366H6Q7_9BACT|nr:DUF58 domain-containing protein [Roseimicrobium gellanilyticum]RBP37684.1 uncharacterized protein DUF58 [Roseimicrobium gellanilyticum]
MAAAVTSSTAKASTPAALAAIHARMKAVTGVARLPLRSGQWSGTAGSVLGQGTGSSIDFQDQRPYLPGDDPRHINWQAYARSGNYTMKLYRQEVTPRVDILFDASPSMFLTTQKATRSWELLYFCLESALRLGASTRVHMLDDESRDTPVDRLLAYDWPLKEKLTGVMLPSLIDRTPMRTGSLRILLSDLLSESPPDRVTNQLVTGKGRAVILVPFCQEESQPDWEGNIEFEECESTLRDKRRVEKDTMTRYHRAYATHFSLWREQCVRHGMGFARVPAEVEILAALRMEAVGSGCIDM